MKNTILFTVLIASVMSVSSCRKDDVVNSIPDATIFPLSIGNKWNYSIATSRTDTLSTSMSITSFDTVKSFAGYRLKGFLLWSWRSTYCANSSVGVYMAIDPDENAPAPYTPHPLISGKGFSFPTFMGDTWQLGELTLKTIGLSQSISVQAGTFSCVNYGVFQSDSSIANMWLAENIGIIKVCYKSGSDTIIYNLVSYDLH